MQGLLILAYIEFPVSLLFCPLKFIIAKWPDRAEQIYLSTVLYSYALFLYGLSVVWMTCFFIQVFFRI